VTVDRGAQPGLLSNTATLTGGGDGNPGNNSVTDAGAVSEPAIDLHVEKTVTNTPLGAIGYRPGSDPITYRIEVSNHGVANAASVELSELLDRHHQRQPRHRHVHARHRRRRDPQDRDR
jgi:hypothetical protein